MLKRALFLCLLVLAGCGGSTATADDPPASTSTTVPDGMWFAPAHYQFDYRPGCFCDTTPLGIEVQGDKVVKHTVIGAASGVGGTPYTPTIDQLLAEVDSAHREATGEIDVKFDANGIPVSASIDWHKNAIDDEMGWKIENYEPLP